MFFVTVRDHIFVFGPVFAFLLTFGVFRFCYLDFESDESVAKAIDLSDKSFHKVTLKVHAAFQHSQHPNPDEDPKQTKIVSLLRTVKSYSNSSAYKALEVCPPFQAQYLLPDQNPALPSTSSEHSPLLTSNGWIAQLLLVIPVFRFCGFLLSFIPACFFFVVGTS